MMLYTNLVLGLHISPWHPVLAFTTMHRLKLGGLTEDEVIEIYGYFVEHTSIFREDRRKPYEDSENYNHQRLRRLKVQLR